MEAKGYDGLENMVFGITRSPPPCDMTRLSCRQTFVFRSWRSEQRWYSAIRRTSCSSLSALTVVPDLAVPLQQGPKSFHEAMYKATRAGGSAQHLNTVSEGVTSGGGKEQPKDAAAA